MIFATDLDGTIIFSKRMFIDVPADTKLVPVERKGEEEISFMTEKSIWFLKAISQHMTFIPVTTRTLEQYKRIDIFQNDILPEFAVICNGAEILVRGEPDGEWKVNVERNLKELPVCCSEVYNEFSGIMNQSWVESSRLIDDLFWMFIIDKNSIPHVELGAYKQWAGENGWSVSVQGRKLYIIPQCINKWDALQYISNRMGDMKIVSAGDSLLDYPMLINSDVAFVPPHGELKVYLTDTCLTKKCIRFTNKSGIMAGEELLSDIHKCFIKPKY